MPAADQLAASICGPKKITKSTFAPLNHVEAAQLKLQLTNEAAALAQVSIASLFEAVYGVNKRRYSWSIIKCYYSLYFSIKARLALRGTSIFYLGRSPYSVTAAAGEHAHLRSGNSHQVVFSIFRHIFASDLVLSQDIGGYNPLDWFESVRNTINYKTAPFSDPLLIDYFSGCETKIRNSLIKYFIDEDFIIHFQENHAAIALNVLNLRQLNKDLYAFGKEVSVNKHYVDILSSIGCYAVEIPNSLSVFDFATVS
jgi:hypothetical protein